MTLSVKRTHKNKIIFKNWQYVSDSDFNRRARAYKIGCCLTEFALSTAALRQKIWKQGLLYSTTGSLESGMKEMNTAANHSSLLAGSFSKPLLCLSALWRRGGRLVIQLALGSSQYTDGFTHLLTFTHFNWPGCYFSFLRVPSEKLQQTLT